MVSLPALPLQSRPVHPKLNQPAVLHFGDIARPPVWSTEANIRRLRAEHVDLAH